jgi:2-polyprenyl-3-methyl-5-hydroxy-6-metoxy-1,4-benzoquinol methylase
MTHSLSNRDRRPELMDDPALDPAEHRRALAGLARINAVGGNGLWRPIREFARSLKRPVRILDVACGSGDVLVRFGKQAKRDGVAVELAGCDLSPTAIQRARERAGSMAEFHICDAIQSELPSGFDVVTCSLFLHHLDEPDAIRLLQRMNAASEGIVLVSDLARSRWNYRLVWLACHFLTRSRVVRYDGPVSVRAAFTPREALALAEKAGIRGATVSSHFPARFVLAWTKS